jgi:hypothetical protein
MFYLQGRQFIASFRFLRFGAILKQIHHLQEGALEGVVKWQFGILWVVLNPVDNTPKSKCGLREMFEDACFDKPTSIDSSFRGGKRI